MREEAEGDGSRRSMRWYDREWLYSKLHTTPRRSALTSLPDQHGACDRSSTHRLRPRASWGEREIWRMAGRTAEGGTRIDGAEMEAIRRCRS